MHISSRLLQILIPISSEPDNIFLLIPHFRVIVLLDDYVPFLQHPFTGRSLKNMTISKITESLEAQVICNENLVHTEIVSACGSDLMSDVMAFVKDQVLLLTGLINVQVIRTANLMDIQAICFVRGKQPTAEMIEMAEEMGIVLLTTKLPMFIACGKLYEAGLVGSGVRKI